MRHRIFQLIPIFMGFFIMGFCDIVGISSDYVQRALGWSDWMTGFVPSMVFIWFLFFSIPLGNIMNRCGRKNCVMLSLVTTTIGSMLPLFGYNSVICFMAFALLGIGNAILQVSLNPLVNNVVINPHQLTSTLTLGQVVKAFSSMLGPEIILLAIGWWGQGKWFLCFPLLGAFALLTIVIFMLSPIKKEQTNSGNFVIYKTFSILANKKILILFLGVIFIVGLDVSVNYISSKLMITRFGWEEEQAKYAPQAYFLLRTIGALMGSVLLVRVPAILYLRINILCAVIAILALMFIFSPQANVVFIAAIGFFASSVFSIIYSMALQEDFKRGNEISGLMITGVSGGAVITPILGFFIEKFGMIGGISVILVCAFYLTFCAFCKYDDVKRNLNV